MIYALHQMNQKVKVNIAVEQAYMELAEQMNLEEACAFGEILLFAKRLGGNYGKNIQRTATKLGEKMSLQEEITTMMAQKKLEMKVMLVIPLAIIAYVRLTSADLLAVLYGNLAGGLIMSVCLVVYVLMALWSRRIMDIADSKFHDGDETVGPKVARAFLTSENVSEETINHVVKIIENISFKGGNFEKQFTSKELEIVQDADRLDAIGAVGIARTFNYGGYKNREIYNPEISPNLTMSKEEYKNSTAPTINHFYEKLLLLKDKMNTETGKKIAQLRHDFMETFLEQFYNEWNGNL
jgi:uncharacterized protein